MLSTTPSLPYFEVIVNGTYLTQYASKVEIIQQTNSHPVALLTVSYIGQRSAQGAPGVKGSWQYISEQTPIAINYGYKPGRIAQFLGYIASYTLLNSGNNLSQNGLLTTDVQYTIVGTSQVMQTTKNRAWKHISPSAIAASIATENGFRSVVHPYAAAINYRLQNSSDFQFLDQLAKEIGYRFYVDNTDLYFINPKLILDRSNIRNVPQFWSYNNPGFYDTLRSFTPIVGTITPDGGIVANRTVSGINPTTGNTVVAVNQIKLTTSATSNVSPPATPTITKYYNDAPADSFYEAQQKIVADTNRNLYWITADATLRGDFRVKPNILVELIGAALPLSEAGFWLVQSSTHCLTMPAPTGNKVSATYTISAEIVRDQVYAATTVITPSTTSSSIQKVPGVLVGSVWRSSNVGAQINAS
jgi:hypothetical protein